MSLRCLLLGAVCTLLTASVAQAAEPGESVVVVYNSRMPESKEVAEYYANKRKVPADQIIGLEMPTAEAISRADFAADIQKPLFKALERKKLFVIRSETIPATNGNPSRVNWRVKESKIRYAVLCYGVPTRIQEDGALGEQVNEQMPEQLRYNRAAVDSELALLPMHDYKLPLTGLIQNTFLESKEAGNLHPTNGLLMVARLDGPSAQIAKGLVDKALEAERVGLWGRGYFDLRGITNGGFKLGDDLLRSGALVAQKNGWELSVDGNDPTFPGTFVLSQVGLYAGWYDVDASGPFLAPQVEFMPGAFAYHIHSFSAATIRDPKKHWVGPLLAKGATATVGYVDEPYLGGTLELGVFLDRFFRGFTLGEAAYSALNALSWQATVVGDPLYRPYDRPPQQLHERLSEQKSKLIEWSHLGVVNLNIVKGFPIEESIGYINEVGTNSPVLMEKLGDIYTVQKKTWPAIEAYAQALNSNPSPQQELRLLLALGEKLHAAGKKDESLNMYRLVAKKAPNYPGMPIVTQRIAELTATGTPATSNQPATGSK